MNTQLQCRKSKLEVSLRSTPLSYYRVIAACNMIAYRSVTDEVFVTHIVSTLTLLATSRLHGDNLNRARLLSGVMKCLQTIARHNTSQYLLEQILSIVKGLLDSWSIKHGTFSRLLIQLEQASQFIVVLSVYSIPSPMPFLLAGSILEGTHQTASPAISLESLSLDELNLSDVNEPGHTRYSQPRVRNKSVT